MNWKPPITETEWEECLSACADGELDRDSAAALSAHLERDAKRAQQLEVLRETSKILQAWTIDAPVPSATLRTSMAERRTRPSFYDWSKGTMLRHRGTLRVAAAFAIGVLAGGWMMSPNRAATPNAPQAQITQQPTPTTTASTLSQDRVDAVFKEFEAAALTHRIQQAARDGHWKIAVAGLERMETQYAGTEAAVTFEKDPMARRIFRRSFRGRI